MVTAKEIDDKRLEVIESLQLLERLKRRMHNDVYKAAIRAYAKVLARDNVYTDTALKLVRTEFRESLNDFMIDTCGFDEITVSKLSKVKVTLNNLVDQIVDGDENFCDNHNLFTTLGGVVRKLKPQRK